MLLRLYVGLMRRNDYVIICYCDVLALAGLHRNQSIVQA